MKKVVAMALATMFLAGQAAHAADPQQERQETMKGVGQAMGQLAKTAKGEIDFDAEAVKASFQTMNNAAQSFADQFPEGTESGHETEAGPKIWSDRDGFNKAVKQFETDTASAVNNAPQDLDSLRAALGQVGQNCKTCHEGYRVKKN